MKPCSVVIFASACLTLPLWADTITYHIDELNEQLTTDIPGATVSQKFVESNGSEFWLIRLGAGWSVDSGLDLVPEPGANPGGLINVAAGVSPHMFESFFTINVFSETPPDLTGPPRQDMIVFDPNEGEHSVVLSDRLSNAVPDSAAAGPLLLFSLAGLLAMTRRWTLHPEAAQVSFVPIHPSVKLTFHHLAMPREN